VNLTSRWCFQKVGSKELSGSAECWESVSELKCTDLLRKKYSKTGIAQDADIRTSARDLTFMYCQTGWTTGVRLPARVWIFLFATPSRPALGPTQPPIQWVPVVVSPRAKRPGTKLATRFHLLQRLRMRGATPPLP
jgi:hypothetical protein